MFAKEFHAVSEKSNMGNFLQCSIPGDNVWELNLNKVTIKRKISWIRHLSNMNILTKLKSFLALNHII